MNLYDEWDMLFGEPRQLVDWKTYPDRSQYSAHEAQAMQYNNLLRNQPKALAEPRWSPGDTVRTRRDRVIDIVFTGIVMVPVRQDDGSWVPNPRIVEVDGERMWQYRICVAGRKDPISRVEKDLLDVE